MLKNMLLDSFLKEISIPNFLRVRASQQKNKQANKEKKFVSISEKCVPI